MNDGRILALSDRARQHAALGDVGRLAIVEELRRGDTSPSRLGIVLGMGSNLLAHHLHVLEEAGLIRRVRSQADRRRSYLRLVHEALDDLIPSSATTATRVLFVCTENAARSQLAAAIWSDRSAIPAASAGTHPAARVHPGAVDAARRHGLFMIAQTPALLSDVHVVSDLVVTVCDRAHEELPADGGRRHWSIQDPVRAGSAEAFDAAVADLTARITRLAEQTIPA
jgi:ArsR family transcriptional regulator, arsenate/arsenite/antimonite-responsive transcriptional repressor / arsenate reductase (thioredoxin)